MDENKYATLAEETAELYEAFIRVGFNEEQALELVKTQYSFAVVNWQADNKRRKTEQLHRNIARLRKEV